MRERRPDQATSLDLPGTVLTLASEQHLRLDEVQRIGDRRIVRGFDRVRDLTRRHRPKSRNRLHRAERQVEPCHRALARTRIPDQRGRQLARRCRLTTMLTDKELSCHLTPNAGRLTNRLLAARFESAVDLGIECVDDLVAVNPVRGPEWQPRKRITARPEQLLHLLCGHHIAGLKPVDTGQSRTDPATRRLALRRVVARQRSPALLGRIEGGDLPRQILIPRPGRQLV